MQKVDLFCDSLSKYWNDVFSVAKRTNLNIQ